MAFLYILLTVHLGMILVNNQLDALSLMYLFISPLYMFRKTQCSSSGDQLHQHITWYVLFYVGDCLVCRHTRQSPA
jgi:cytochrome b561